ncbi:MULTISPECIES: peptidoglycan-binding protein [unclassified Streptomyces]|uniref:peptidoglycan-binding protein n=1 Tax=unclassified Streptomyces TaxID=2593676 RepID=UPI001313E0DB|nr:MULTISPECIES: peptidoglycan-binding protein [unclassified Streptomyces]
MVLALFGSCGSVWWIASQARTPEQRAANAGPPPPSDVTATVSDQRIVERLELTGRVQTSSRTTISGVRPEGTSRAVVTGLPAKAGESLRGGAVVAEVSGRPVLLLPGRFPAYRDLRIGDKGPDVRQLQRALRPLYGVAVTGTYGPATADAVRRLYAAAGYEAPRSTAPPEAAESGDEAASADASPGTRARGGAETDGGTGQPPASGDEASDRATSAARAPEQHQDTVGGTLPAAEVTYVAAVPATVVRVSAEVGDTADGPLVTVGSGGRQVRATLTADQRTRLRDMPDDAVIRFGEGPYDGRTGSLGSLRAVAGEGKGDEGADEGKSDTYEALFVPPAGTAKDGARQQITVELRKSPADSLTVPVSAVWTDLGGSASVTVLENGSKRDVSVEVLFTYDGLTAVRALDDGLRASQKVMLTRRGDSSAAGGTDG